MTRRRYRKDYGLTAEQMDNEPAYEVRVNQAFWVAEHKRQRLEQLRAEQSAQ